MENFVNISNAVSSVNYIKTFNKKDLIQKAYNAQFQLNNFRTVFRNFCSNVLDFWRYKFNDCDYAYHKLWPFMIGRTR